MFCFLLSQSSSWEDCSITHYTNTVESTQQAPPPLDLPKELYQMVDFIKRHGVDTVSWKLRNKHGFKRGSIECLTVLNKVERLCSVLIENVNILYLRCYRKGCFRRAEGRRI